MKKVTDQQVKNMMTMGGAEYARQEAWDIQNAAQVLGYIAGMVGNEVHEPADVQSLANIMRSLMEFITGEISEMVSAAKEGGDEYKSADVTGTPEFAEPTTTPAQVKEAEPLNLDYVKSLGVEMPGRDLAVKYVSRDTIRHPVFIWGSKDRPDLEGDFFTRDTDFWDEILGKSARPLTWDHAQDPEFMADPLIGQTVEWEDDDIARWAISTLKKGHKYRSAIDALIERRSLGSAAMSFDIPVIGASSDSAPQYVKRVSVGKSNWIERWPWFATALTPAPCEPLMVSHGVDFLKSLGIALPDNPEDWEGEKAILEYFKFRYL